MIKILLTGATGAMGKAVIEAVSENDEFEIVAGLAEDDLNQKIKIYKKFDQIEEKADAIIDFSSRNILKDELDYCKKESIPLVLATTGLLEEDFELIDQYSKYFPILQSGNFSLGINVLQKLARELAKTLEDFDIEIIEKHHNKKKDAPSGTAKMLFDSVNEVRENKLVEVNSRANKSSEREKNEVGISSIRAGSIVGEHEIIFAAKDEIISVSHTAFSKQIFANGSLKACKFLIGRVDGRYDMKDVLGG